jgi:hypothetical protein
MFLDIEEVDAKHPRPLVVQVRNDGENQADPLRSGVAEKRLTV